MSVFGPFYPRPLQSSVSHAERLARAVAVALADTPRADVLETRSPAEVWLIGRAGEIEALVGDVVADWRAGIASARAASATIDGYLEHLHRGFVVHAGAGSPPCCRPSEATVEGTSARAS